MGSRGRRFKSCHPDHKDTNKKRELALLFLSIRSGLLLLRSKSKTIFVAIKVASTKTQIDDIIKKLFGQLKRCAFDSTKGATGSNHVL